MKKFLRPILIRITIVICHYCFKKIQFLFSSHLPKIALLKISLSHLFSSATIEIGGRYSCDFQFGFVNKYFICVLAFKPWSWILTDQMSLLSKCNVTFRKSACYFRYGDFLSFYFIKSPSINVKHRICERQISDSLFF